MRRPCIGQYGVAGYTSLGSCKRGRGLHQLDELTTKYFQAYSHLARMNIRSLERALALRRMVIAKMQTPPDEAGYAERLNIFEAKGLEVGQEADAARRLINAIIEDVTTDSDNAAAHGILIVNSVMGVNLGQKKGPKAPASTWRFLLKHSIQFCAVSA